jgi:hypothetical protein
VSASPVRRGWPIGLVVLVVVVLLGISGVIYGGLNRPHFDVFLFDAGAIEDYGVGELRYFPQARIYVIALDEDPGAKNLRALDALSPHGTRCVIESDPKDVRGAERNPRREPGVFKDPCSQAVWYLTGDALTRTSQPLETFHITQPPPHGADGRLIVEVEVIGRPNLAEDEPQR